MHELYIDPKKKSANLRREYLFFWILVTILLVSRLLVTVLLVFRLCHSSVGFQNFGYSFSHYFLTFSSIRIAGLRGPPFRVAHRVTWTGRLQELGTYRSKSSQGRRVRSRRRCDNAARSICSFRQSAKIGKRTRGYIVVVSGALPLPLPS